MNEAETENGNNITNNGDNDTAYGDSHLVVGNCGENLSYNNNVDDSETSTDDDIESGADIGSVETKGISRGSNCTETHLEYKVNWLHKHLRRGCLP